MLNLDTATKNPGCPQCGQNTWGMPTDTGFVWATCDSCLERMNGELHSQEASGADSKPVSIFL